ncbi:MAG TPA: glycoside hydrolase family 5 protein [Fibrobacteria bacterium]|nr:glycoside hydrolase family 5 protein [Fibrobacteria bacterium]
MPAPRLILAGLLSACLVSPASATYLHRQGNKLLDANGKEVRLTGVNWFGFETGNLAPHGLWARDWLGVLRQVKDMGFNCIRIPYCDRMLEPDAKTQSINTYGNDPYRTELKNAMNKELEGKTPLEVLDIIVGGCRQLGLKVILDNHARNPDGYMEEKIWTTASVSEEKWIANWVMIAKRYKGNDAVVAFDLDNEPHGKMDEGGAEWGTGTAGKDWRQAAQKCGNAILAENPDVLIVVEGVQQAQAGGETYWWGGNLTGVKSAPVVLSKPEKLIYSPHEYGPEVFAQTWFSSPDFPSNLPGIWDKFFGYLVQGGESHLLVGEFGLREASGSDGKAGIWFDAFLKYMGKDYSWTFWCLNPNSGDTGGLLKSDWMGVEQWKLDKLKPYMAPLIGGPASAIRHVRRGAPPAEANQVSPVDANGRTRPADRAKVPLFSTP